MKRPALTRALAAAALIGAALGPLPLHAAPTAARAAEPVVDRARLDYGLKARELAPGVFVVEGANADFSPANGCNIINTGFLLTGEGVVVINTGTSRLYGEQLRALIARTTKEPVREVIHLNLHPDYFLGNQAFADVPRRATAATLAGMKAEHKAYEDNLYRLCGDWMKGTEVAEVLPNAPLEPGVRKVGSRSLEIRLLQGHTASDAVLIDTASGVVFAGGLVFAQRIPTTPHAQIGPWLQSLAALKGLPARQWVPSHGPVHPAGPGPDGGLAQTERYLQWLDGQLGRAARQGWDMNELLRSPVPAEFKGWAAFQTEWVRNVVHLYPRYEQAELGGLR